MSGGVTAATIAGYVAAGAAVVGAGYAVYSGEQQKSAQKDAQNKADESNRKQEAASKVAADNAKKTANQQEQQINKANAKTPDVGAMLSGNMVDAKAGNLSTMLTGPQGVDAATLSLGKNTLLGS